jgi:adenosylcobyric acid synthase
MQMLGRTITDANGVEGPPRSVDGLGLLDLETDLTPEKLVGAGCFRDRSLGVSLDGYEIHLGRTSGEARPFLFDGERPVGWREGNVTGVYVHGLADNRAFVEWLCGASDVALPTAFDTLDVRLDRLAMAVEPRLQSVL